MDHIISLGKENHALLIDCRDLSYQLVPLPAGIACNLRQKRRGCDSEYNTRRSECEEGAVWEEGDVSPEMFAERRAA